MPVEIDENQLAGLRGLQEFVGKAMADPQHRRKLLEVQKALYPNIAVPEIDAANPVLDELAKLRADFDADRKSREEASAKQSEDATKAEWERKWSVGREMLAQRHSNP